MHDGVAQGDGIAVGQALTAKAGLPPQGASVGIHGEDVNSPVARKDQRTIAAERGVVEMEASD